MTHGGGRAECFPAALGGRGQDGQGHSAGWAGQGGGVEGASLARRAGSAARRERRGSGWKAMASTGLEGDGLVIPCLGAMARSSELGCEWEKRRFTATLKQPRREKLRSVTDGAGIVRDYGMVLPECSSCT